MSITEFSPLNAVKILTEQASQLGKPYQVTIMNDHEELVAGGF